MFNEAQLQQIRNHGIQFSDIEKQIENFRKGFDYAQLIKPATIGDGISFFEKKEVIDLAGYYDKISNSKTIIKFVPASGAASRMFKDLFSFLESYTGSKEEIVQIMADKSFNSIISSKVLAILHFILIW